jgi:signal transduction histidine kinase/ActR/RegA family two-component response regulator
MRDETATAEQIRKLTARLEEAEDTLRAVRSGEIDAFIVQGPKGEQIYSLRSAEQPYRNLVEDMLEGAAILTTEGDIAYCNKRFAELVAIPLEDVIGGPMERFVNSVDRAAYRAMLAAGSGKRRTKLLSADGRAIDVFLSFTTSVCDDVSRLNVIVTDLSELLDAQSSRDRAEQQSQAKDEFMAMLAHELRNPLSAVTAAVKVLEMAKGQEIAATRARCIIGRQVQHLSKLVDDLLDVGRVVTGKIVLDKHSMDFCELVRRTATVFGEREAQHRFDIKTESVWVEGDAVRLEQIVSNIIGNAVKYTPAGGNISVSLRGEGAEAVLRVQDDGFGIAPELLPVVFDLFVQGERTLDRAQGGLGIGLTLVRRLVDLHKGSVSVFSEGNGRGSVFTVRLPRVPAARNAASPCDAPRTDAIRRRVLIVEDNRDAREMFRMMLELDGHEVLEAEEGYSGLEMLRAQAPDVAFIDVGLPGLDGYEIARQFRREGCEEVNSNAPDARNGHEAAARNGHEAAAHNGHEAAACNGPEVAASGNGNGKSSFGRAGDGNHRVLLVALTGYGTPEALARSRKAGFDYHLIKPVNPETLYKLLNDEDLDRSHHSDHRAMTLESVSSQAADGVAAC